jgi:acyl carrier protein
MTVDEFLGQLTDAIEADAPLRTGQSLAETAVWDSLAVLSVVDLFEQIGVEADLDSIGNAATTDDLIALAASAVS